MIKPLRNDLRPTEMSTRLGAKVTVHSGVLVFSTTAFDPGAVVVATAVPRVGQNIVKTFTERELRWMQ